MADLSNLIQDLNVQKELIKSFEQKFAVISGEEGVKFIRDNFNKQRYEQISWVPRHKLTNKTYDKHPFYKGTVYSSRKPLLQQTGALKKSIRFIKKGKQAEIGVLGGKSVVKGISSEIAKYAKEHNEGAQNVRWKHIKSTIPDLPQRQFMPREGEAMPITLERTLVKKSVQGIKKIMYKFKGIK